jgi:hypothetical protein
LSKTSKRAIVTSKPPEIWRMSDKLEGARRMIELYAHWKAHKRRVISKTLFAAALFLWSSTTHAKVAIITADPNAPGATIPQNFMGISTEPQDAVVDNIFVPQNTSLINLLRLLEPNALWRIGGRSTDNPPAAITPQIANDVAAFAHALGWSLLINLPAASGTDTAVQQAQLWLNATRGQSVAFQVGNEPDYLFYGDAQAWANAFNGVYSALPGVAWGGPDTTSVTDKLWWDDLTIPTASGMAYVTGHKYSLGCNYGPGSVTVTPDQVIADATLPYYPGARLTEWGIICEGGYLGITNTDLAATYYLRLAQSAIANGWSGLNPHNGLTPSPWSDGTERLAYYNQIVQLPDGSWGPLPMFYGMWMWAQLVGQQTIAASADGLDPLASVTATIGPTGNANILVVNGDTQSAVAVSPDQTSPWSFANVYVVSGQSCTDPAPTLNGAPIGGGGSWSGAPEVITPRQSISITPCGAALIEMH